MRSKRFLSSNLSSQLEGTSKSLRDKVGNGETEQLATCHAILVTR